MRHLKIHYSSKMFECQQHSGLCRLYTVLSQFLLCMSFSLGDSGVTFKASSALSLKHCKTHLFSRARKKGFSFFSCGATPSGTVPKTQPLQVAFSLPERADLRSQKEGFWGRKLPGEGWGGEGKQKEKRMRKKKLENIHVSKECSTPGFQGVETSGWPTSR